MSGVPKTTRPASVGPRLELPTSQSPEGKETNSPKQAAKNREHFQTEPRPEQRPFVHGMLHHLSIQGIQYPTAPRSPQTCQNIVERPVINRTEAMNVQNEANVYSSLCDARGGLEDPYL